MRAYLRIFDGGVGEMPRVVHRVRTSKASYAADVRFRCAVDTRVHYARLLEHLRLMWGEHE